MTIQASGPFVVGQHASLTVGLAGPVTEVGENHVVIGGVRFPIRLNVNEGGITAHYLSTDVPQYRDDDDLVTLDEPYVEDSIALQHARNHVRALSDAIERQHDDDDHDGPLRFCHHSACAALGGRS